MAGLDPMRGLAFRGGAAAAAMMTLLLTACALEPERQSAAEARPQAQLTARQVLAPVPPPVTSTAAQSASRPANARGDGGKIAEIYPATGGTIDPAAIGSGAATARRGDITLNFTDADVRQVAQVVLRDLLGVNYVIDPDVRGTVSVETGRPLARRDLIPVLESILETVNAALVRNAGVYRITTVARAPGGGDSLQLGADGRGFAVSVYPLAYIGAEEMARIVAPLLPDGRVVRADASRGLITVAGTGREQKLVAEAIEIFDVDQMAGTSVLLESLTNVEVNTLVFELDNVFGGLQKGPLAGLVRVIPVERMNAVMVISKQPQYLDQARNWIARLDRTRNAKARRLFVYYAQNGKAVDLAQTLRGILDAGDDGATPVTGVSLAPVLAAAAESTAETATDGALPTPPAAKAEDVAVRIMADEPNNAVLVLATPAEYDLIEEVLVKLDIQPLQVLIEATIIEITLRDQLRFGLQYFIRSGGLGITDTGSTVLSRGTSSLIQSALPGFSFTLADTDQARAIVDTLSQLTELKVVSSPQVMVLDNQPAKLHVGDQVPIITQSSISNITDDSRTVNAVEYRDTGVTLEVTPRINASGLVTLEIAQEVSDVVETDTSGIDSPTIQQRQILSTVAIAGGQTVALGGLIRESSNDSRSGVPFLVDLPVVGPLFGDSAADLNRTELLVLLTPSVVRNQREAYDLTASLRNRYQALLDLERDGVRQPRRFGDAPEIRLFD